MSEFLFSVVTAAYNAAPWIQNMLHSVAKQSIGFKANIQLIVVDDGSTDETAEIVHEWISLFPQNITLIHQENSGPSSARNHGLKLAVGKWITFIDADDFVSPCYFQIVQNFLDETHFDGPIIACNLLFYFEATKQSINGHGLNYKFTNTHISNLLNEPNNIQLSLSSCFISHHHKTHTRLKIDERVRPTFEDAHFLNLLLLHSGDFRIAFLKDAHYYYRRRGEGTGLVEGGWANPAKYHDQILFGYLHLLQQYQRTLGRVPEFIQNLVIYEAHWYMVRLLEGLPDCPLSSAQRESFFELMRLVFRHIDMRQILLSSLPVLGLRTRIAMLKAFKNSRFTIAPPMVAEISATHSEALLTHWSTDEAVFRFYTGTEERPIPWQKHIVHQFGETSLCHEYRHWIPLHEQGACRIEIDGKPVGVFCRDRMLDIFDGELLRQTYYLPESALPTERRALLNLQSSPEAETYQNCWILMDRVHKADDNAEHLCRWLRENHPEQPVFFVLERKSKDWTRLNREGFPLLAYGSKEHYTALTKSEWLISSHVDIPVTDPMGTRTLFGVPSYKTAFLQHGIIMHDLSRWLNQFNIDFMVTSVQPEYESLIKGKYKFTKREVVLTGLPRHDSLLFKTKTKKPSRAILVCPTWREHLRSTEAHVPGLKNDEAHTFQKSDYFRNWNAVTASQSLAQLADDHGFRLLFLPHPEIVRFLPLFQRSKAFSFLSWTDLKSVQDLLATCSMAITDYSSFAFEMGYIGRPVAYYQFPESPDFISTQVKPGYFSYEKHGLGPVLRTKEALEDWLHDCLRQGCTRQEPYNSRADSFFTLRDGQNCRRVYEAIIKR
ncbi:MAG: glycosyltransferase [Bacteroidia bacterium]|nr:glycosyltransferase [Bacteroidia bacterium]